MIASGPKLSLRLSLSPVLVEPQSILLVDDDADLRRGISRVLTTLGHSVVEAGGVEEAKAAASLGAPFQLVISDYHLPDGTGLDVHAWLNRAQCDPFPFVLMSGDYFPSLDLSEGCPFLPKPFSVDQLQQAIAQAGSGRATRPWFSRNAC